MLSSYSTLSTPARSCMRNSSGFYASTLCLLWTCRTRPSIRLIRRGKMFLVETIFLIMLPCCCSSLQTGDVKVIPAKYEVEPGSNLSFVCETTTNISEFKWEILKALKYQRKSEIKSTNHSMELRLSGVHVNETESHVLCIRIDRGVLASSTIRIGNIPVAPKLECMMQNLDTMHCRWKHCDPDPGGWNSRRYSVSYHTTHYRETENKHGNCNMSSDIAIANSTDCRMFQSGNCGSHANSGPPKCSSFCSATETSGWEYWEGTNVRLVVTNRIGTNASQVSFTPKKNVILSSPLLNIQNVTDRDEEFTSVLITTTFRPAVKNHHFLEEYCEEKLLLQIHYEKVSYDSGLVSLKHGDEEEFWNDWSNYRVNSPSSDHGFGNDAENVMTKDRQVMLTQLPANTTFAIAARWKYNGTSCNGPWSPFTFSQFKTSLMGPPKFLQAAILYFDHASAATVPGETCNVSSPIILWKDRKQLYSLHQNNDYNYRLSSFDRKCFSPISISKSSNFARFDADEIVAGCRIKIFAVNELGNSSIPYYLSKPSESYCTPRILSMKTVQTHQNTIRFEIDWIFHSSNPSIVCNGSFDQDNISISLFTWEENCVNCRKRVEPRESSEKVTATAQSFFADVVASDSGDAVEYFPIGLRKQKLNSSSASFTYSFQPHTAYSMSASLSFFDGETVFQSPASLANEIYYLHIEEPNGIPRDIIFTDVEESSMTVKWRAVSPEMRRGPITGYVIYVTQEKRCFSGEDNRACGNPHEKCGPLLVRNLTIHLENPEILSEDSSSSWKVETSPGDKEFSHRIEGLESGTHHYIGIAAFNAAGIGRCFGYSTRATRAQRDMRIVVAAGCFLALAAAAFCVYLCVLLRNRHGNCMRRSVPRPVISISLRQSSEAQDCGQHIDENRLKLDLSFEYADLFDEVKPLNSEVRDNNNLGEKIILRQYDNSATLDRNSLAAYLKDACSVEDGSLSSGMPCCSSTTENESAPSSQCDYSGDGMSTDDEDPAVYTSTETALIFSRNRRRLFV